MRTKSITIFGIIGLLLILTSCKKELETPQNIQEEIDNIIMPYIISGNRVGVAVGVYDNGETNFFSYGTKNLEDGGEIDENTMFEIGSITKTFTTIMLAKLSLEGVVSMDDAIQQFFPSNVSIPSYGEEQIRLINLANHSSSLPRMPDNIDDNAGNEISYTYLENDLFDFLNNYSLTTPIGGKGEYSNIGMGILGYILKNENNTTYNELLRDGIFVPLNMNSTVLDYENISTDNIAQGYDGNTEQEESLFSEVFEGAGAIKSNIPDMLKYLEATLSEDSDSLFLAMQQAHIKTIETEGNDSEIGLGWFIETIDDGQEIVFHDGGTAGFNSFIAFNKDTKKGVIILLNTNVGFAGGQIDIGKEIMGILNKY